MRSPKINNIMTASEIAKALGVTEGTKTFEFPEPVVFSQKGGRMPEAQYSIASADITERNGWTRIIIKGTQQTAYSLRPLSLFLKWDQLPSPARHLIEDALLRFNA